MLRRPSSRAGFCPFWATRMLSLTVRVAHAETPFLTGGLAARLGHSNDLFGGLGLRMLPQLCVAVGHAIPCHT
jgi:hypothetical protein